MQNPGAVQSLQRHRHLAHPAGDGGLCEMRAVSPEDVVEQVAALAELQDQSDASAVAVEALDQMHQMRVVRQRAELAQDANLVLERRLRLCRRLSAAAAHELDGHGQSVDSPHRAPHLAKRPSAQHGADVVPRTDKVTDHRLWRTTADHRPPLAYDARPSRTTCRSTARTAPSAATVSQPLATPPCTWPRGAVCTQFPAASRARGRRVCGAWPLGYSQTKTGPQRPEPHIYRGSA
mmetsp:Transcript_5215/g.18472  ORF Transcript_5215/g.18472 Transcript_5215/m.18472 type:complete len:235 (+) Transcript_5215:2986-3690(+)